ncbi:acetate--CoA ligase [Candidatus Falkowbacteria bacterium RIFOXYB2_FULL_34_18]|uniref:Acetate--CoA ligase n=1 Tax=Candidatus Falkowbacteria bacterium RIFOXYD2_FULL_34_120 TaxID=1798007 RepID=A0A1F5TMM8_9BACT|nr:MAG: acetate--CoA ligase [Candidatus Falkowbacteria bacterium RIFOXYC12_FULL_34_55]OGF28598.1 MAG: acetate--CoA ligase [Candidatus Falkowbacteria bacterium RIFOXYB2_FULL_34_18]OGF38039.1 MAG: acetate--CoA ligase [Candidatus Falkowbacteria bacterium RIFOXYC2_FULL_34_220]OGF38288.1 MAG: acetate--CoA ligase [Candidatus Falkowbacteria bacterium RIFOXYD12_FULL_34_57]OGF40200.1 MAG: acetate--CoA ligase [Candidatus Falkowbacteria bacterium RIFOXYD2_FULL_34_120]
MAKKESRELTDVLSSSQKKYKPSKEMVQNSNAGDYEAILKKAAKNPLKFWEEAANNLKWFKKWDEVFSDKEKPFFKWFLGAKCNLAYNALDRHIEEGKINKKTAIIWEEESGRTRKFTYQELYTEVNKLANALRGMGVDRGDRIAIYMPNIPEIVFAMLACAKVGAMHSVVYAGFSSKALADRIDDAQAKVLFTADGSFRRGKVVDLKSIADAAVKNAKSIEKVVVVQNNKAKVNFNKKCDVWYHDFVKGQSVYAHCAEMDSEDPAFVLYTSGTTSKPKGVIHVHGGYPVGVLQTMKYVFDIKGDEIFWCTADPGWITGHSYIIYGPLLAGITTLMYEGVPDMPKPDRIWKVVEKYKVNILYTAPTLIRAMMKYGINWPKAHKMESLRLLGSVGEPINPEAWKWFYTYVGKKRCPIMDTWWQTETGMNMITPLPSAPLKAGSACKPFPGIIADVVDKKGKSVPTGKGGFLVIRNQWPSMIRTIFNNPERYIKTYWSEIRGMYFAGDVAAKDKEGYFWIQGRTDDVLKVAGHRIGTAEVESAFVSHKSVVEAAVIGVPDPVKGEVIVAFVILAGKVKPSEELNMEIRKHVRKEIGPVAVIKDIKFIDKLPKTRSGKIMRRVLKAQELGLEVGDTSAMVN